MKYVPRPNVVDAIQFNGEVLKDLPSWVVNYKSVAPVGGMAGGETPVTRDPTGGVILVPAPHGYQSCRIGDWLVYDGTNIRVVKGKEFNATFMPLEPVTPEPAPAPTPEPAPAPAPVEDKGFANAPVEGSQPVVTETPETVQPSADTPAEE